MEKLTAVLGKRVQLVGDDLLLPIQAAYPKESMKVLPILFDQAEPDRDDYRDL